jgi:CubicO group peptidase (beta-lactamase class C family)
VEVVSPEAIGFSSARLGRIGDTMRRFVDEGKLAGAVTLVARRGKLAHFEVTGLADVEAKRPMERNTIFRIASMTKPITSVATLLLFEQGHFLLDDPIADYLPEFAQTKVFVRETERGIEVADLARPITIRHLLTHSSGLTSDSYPQDPVSRLYVRGQVRDPASSLAETVRRLAAKPLVHQPGERFTYGFSHDVLGRLVEVISGQSFDVFLRENVFEPLEMIDTGFAVPAPDRERLASVYSSDGRGGFRCDLTAGDRSAQPVYLSGGGGLVSTSTDYARFCQMLLNGGALGTARLLGRKTVELMAANQWPSGASPSPDPEERGYGYGLGVRTLVDVAQSGIPGSVGEYGWWGAYSTFFWIDPREKLIGVHLVQLSPYNFRSGLVFKVLTYQALIA